MPDLGRLLRTQTYAFALVLAVGLLVANLVKLPSFGSPDNLDANLTLFAPFALVAIASTPAILSGGGGIDISVAMIAGLVSNLLILHLLPGSLGHPLVAVPIVLAIGAAIGLLNGFSVAILRYQPVIATLCTMFVLQGVNKKIAGEPIAAPPSWLDDLAGGFGPIPGGVVLLAGPVLVWLILQRTPFHRTLLAVGGNDATAYSAGVQVTAVRLIAYALGGVFASVAGIAIAVLLHSSDATAGLEYILIALAAVALGGTPLMGGRGGLLGAFLGASVIFLMQNLLSAYEIDAYWNQVAYGAMLIVGSIIGAQLTTARRPSA